MSTTGDNELAPRLLRHPRHWWFAAICLVLLGILSCAVRSWAATQQSNLLASSGWVVHSLRDVSVGITEVTHIALSPDGSLWIGTDSGVHTFDDHRWQSFLEIQPPGWPHVYGLTVDSETNVWVTSDLGLTLIDSGNVLSVERYHFSMALATDLNGLAWAAGDAASGISPLTPAGIGPAIPEPSASPRMSWVLAFDPGGHLWVDDFDSLWSFDGHSWLQHSIPVPDLLVKAIAFDAESHPWVGGMTARPSPCCMLVSLESSGWVEHHVPFPRETSATVSALSFDEYGTLWVGFSAPDQGSLSGLASFNGNEWTFYDTGDCIDPLLGAAPNTQAILSTPHHALYFGAGPSLVVFNTSGAPPSPDPVPDRILAARRLGNTFAWAFGLLATLAALTAAWSTFLVTRPGLAWSRRLRLRAGTLASLPSRPFRPRVVSTAAALAIPSACLVLWNIACFLFWQGGSSNLTTPTGRPDFETYASVLSLWSLALLVPGVISGALAYYGALCLHNRTSPTRLVIGLAGILLGAIIFLAALAFTFFAFGMAATG